MTEPRVRSKPTSTGTSNRQDTARPSTLDPRQAAEADAAFAPSFAPSQPPAKFSLRAPPPDGQSTSTGRERLLGQRMQVASGTFYLWLAVATLVAAIGVPIGHDADTMAALREVTEFGAGFERAALERTLHAHASSQSAVSLQKVASKVVGRGVPKVVAEGGPAIAPYAKFEIATLEQVEALTKPNAKLALEVAVPETIAEALAWRLSRLPANERYVLQSVVLSEGGCSAADLSREQEIGRLRLGVMQARAAATSAEQKQLAAQRVYDARRKWKGKSAWKAIAKANEKRVETQAALDQAQGQLLEAGTGYDAVAEQAGRLPVASAGDGSCRVATATLIAKGQAVPIEYRIPARIERRAVAAPKIAGASFAQAKRTGLWSEVKTGTAAVAEAKLRARFSWHNRYTELLGIKVGGMTVLQLAPLLSVGVLLLFIRSCRRAVATYNPFDPPAATKLPSVGFNALWLDAALLIVLPVGGCALCAWGLRSIDQVPAVPVVCGIASVGLGVVAFLALRRLLELREAIMQTRSDTPRSAERSSAR